MNLSAYAKRDADAQKRILEAVGILSRRFGLGEHALTVQAKEPAVKAMLQREQIAAVLEDLVTATEPKSKKATA